MLEAVPTPDKTPRLLDAQAGRIARVVLAVPRRAALHRPGPLRRVLEAIPHRAALDVLVAPEALETVSAWIDETGPGNTACLIQARAGLGFPLWVQDLVIARGSGRLTAIGADSTPSEAAATLARGADMVLDTLGTGFSGGNVIAAGYDLLIGADALRESGLSADDFAGRLDPGRRALVLGTAAPLPPEAARPTEVPSPGWVETVHWRARSDTRQPMPRLDLFVAPAGQTPAGVPRYLVGCPRRGAKALGVALPDHALAEAFEEIAAQLEASGAEVIRNPLPLVCKDDPGRRRRTWYHLPANNVIVEDCGPNNRTVLLPCFEDAAQPALAEIDSMNAAIWAWLGYSVVRVPEMLALAEGFGGPRRIAHVVARD